MESKIDRRVTTRAVGYADGKYVFMKRLTLYLAFMLAVIFSPISAAHQDPEVSGYVKVEGGRIWYRLNGAEHAGEKPTVIAIHGGPGGHHRSMMPLVKLSDSFPVLLYDQLDSGNSDRPGNQANWEVERFVDEIDHIRRKLKLKNVVLVGHSWGGTIAAEYATRRPSGLRGVVLASPAHIHQAME